MPMVYHPNPNTGAMSTGNENTNIAIADTHSSHRKRESREITERRRREEVECQGENHFLSTMCDGRGARAARK